MAIKEPMMVREGQKSVRCDKSGNRKGKSKKARGDKATMSGSKKGQGKVEREVGNVIVIATVSSHSKCNY